jgi:hypothetical protein
MSHSKWAPEDDAGTRPSGIVIEISGPVSGRGTFIARRIFDLLSSTYRSSVRLERDVAPKHTANDYADLLKTAEILVVTRARVEPTRLELKPGEFVGIERGALSVDQAMRIWINLSKQEAPLGACELEMYESVCRYLVGVMQRGEDPLRHALERSLAEPACETVALKEGLVLSAGEAAQWRGAQAEIDGLRKNLEAAHEELSEEVSGRQDPEAAGGVGYMRCSPSLPGYVRGLENLCNERQAEISRSYLKIDELARRLVEIEAELARASERQAASDRAINGYAEQVEKIEAELAGSKRQLDVMQIFPANGIGAFARERMRQVNVEGFTAEHDDAQHARGDMVDAALCYIYAAINIGHPAFVEPPKEWPWQKEWWKPSEDRQRNLEKAGAILAAEWDRIQRARTRHEKMASVRAPEGTKGIQYATDDPRIGEAS